MIEFWQDWQMWLATQPVEWAVLIAAFVSATLLPGGTEVILVAGLLAIHDPWRWVWLVTLASVGNTAGAMVSFFMGRSLPEGKAEKLQRARRWCQRYGAPALLLSWLPVVGDALPLAAGWLEMDWRRAFVYIALGKTARFVVVALIALSAGGMLT